MDFDRNYVLAVTENILNTPSPTGYTHNAVAKIGEFARQLGYNYDTDIKGAGFITIAGRNPEKTVGISAHTDTLGLIVRSVKSSGTLAVSTIGGIVVPTIDGEYCTVFTRDGRKYTGTVLCTSPSGHVHSDAHTKPRTIDNMEIRLDEKVKNKADVEKLGIAPGDYVCIDTKTQILPNGFIKSRFLDDKVSVGVIFGVLKYFKDNNITPKHNVRVMFTVYEEVGHGMALLPDDVSEVVGVDMGCVGADLTGTEYDVCIIAKDSSGPYDYRLTSELVKLAADNGLSYAVDVYERYASDVSSAYRSGHGIRGAMIGPGVHASHGMERSHYDGVYNSMRLLALYLS